MTSSKVKFILTKSMRSKNLASVALALAKAGIPVFPLKPKSKKPIYKGGFKKATTDLDKVKKWWNKHPNANIGSPLVPGLIALDFDGEEGSATFKKLNFQLPYLKVITSRGFHLYVIADLTSKNAVLPGLDVRGGGEGGYIIMPPSVHPSGVRYKWET